MAELRAAWQATGGAGRVVAVTGQAGTGKTRLITEFRTEAARAAVVLAVRCHDGETALPFVLAADLLRAALAVRPDLPEVLPAQTAAIAGRLVPALAAAHPDSVAPALDSPVAVTRLYAAIADTLLAATRDSGAGAVAGAGAAGGPAGMFVVEDVHWADSSASVDGVTRRARRSGRSSSGRAVARGRNRRPASGSATARCSARR